MEIKKLRKIIHDINSPLTSVIGFSELLTKKQLPEKEADWIKKINQEALRIKELMKELSDTIPKTSD